jgi:hypothetical protein
MKLRFMPRSTPGAFDATGPADDAFHRRTATPADDRGERRPRDPAAHRPVSQCLSSWRPAVLAGSGRHPPDCGVRHPEPERTAEPAKSQRPVPATAVIRPPNLNGGSPKVRQARSTVSRWPYVIARAMTPLATRGTLSTGTRAFPALTSRSDDSSCQMPAIDPREPVAVLRSNSRSTWGTVVRRTRRARQRSTLPAIRASGPTDALGRIASERLHPEGANRHSRPRPSVETLWSNDRSASRFLRRQGRLLHTCAPCAQQPGLQALILSVYSPLALGLST